jgi:hypothetical protein
MNVSQKINSYEDITLKLSQIWTNEGACNLIGIENEEKLSKLRCDASN